MASILIVDDEENLHTIYRTLFSLKGHSVVASAHDGLEALERFSKLRTKPDVIIMDHRMPRMDGVTATRKIKKLDSKIKIVFVSADETIRDKALEAGATCFQVKPVRAAELFEIITKVT